VTAAAPDGSVQTGAARAIARCDVLAALSSLPTGIERVAYSEEHRAANALVGEWMREAGLTVRQDAAGERPDAADGADRAGLDRDPLDLDDDLGGGHERVAASRIGGAAGVAGAAGDLQREPARACDGRDHRERAVRVDEVRTLLDVGLEVADQLLGAPGRVADPRGVEPERGHRLRHGRARAVGRREPVLPGPTGEGAGAEQRVAEAGPLLVGEADQLEREGQGCGFDARGHLDGEQDTEHPVEPAGVRDGVEVAAEHERGQPLPLPLDPAADVPGGVLPHGQPGLAHPLADERVRGAVLLGVRDALDAGRQRGERGEDVAAGDRARRPGLRGLVRCSGGHAAPA